MQPLRKDEMSREKFRVSVLTICEHDKEDDEGKRPFKKEAECNQRNENVDKSGDNVEQNELVFES